MRTGTDDSKCCAVDLTVSASGEMLMPMVVFKGARHGRIAARNICNQTQGMVYSMPMQLKPQKNIFWFPMTAQRSTLAIKY